MDVIFERVDARCYAIGILRNGRYDVGADVLARPGPGQGRAPHDLVHFVVEEQAGLTLGIYGQVAAGGDVGGFFRPPPWDRSHARDRRRSLRLGRAGRDQVAMSEGLAATISPDGELDRERLAAVAPDLVDAIAARLEEGLTDWDKTQPGRRLVMTWPERLTIRHGKLAAPART